MAWSVDDLSSITQLLIDKLNAAVLASPQYINQHFLYDVSGLMPAVSRGDGKTVLNLYLLHVSRDPYWRNTPVQGSIAQPNQSQPLSLSLSYLLTSFSENNWALEQILMSIAFEYFHANPIYKSNTVEFTITIEADTIEEMSRLWQAIAVPIRLSSLFRVAVVFLAPPQAPPADARLPVEVNISVAPDLNMLAPVPLPEPQLFELAAQVEYRVPPSAALGPEAAPTFLPSQALPTAINSAPVVMGGQTLRVRGSGLNQPDAAVVYLSSTVIPTLATEWPVNFTRTYGTSASGTAGDADELVLEMPIAYAGLPAAGTTVASTPLPVVMYLCVGNAATPGFRSNTLPIIFAPAVTGIGPGEPVLAADGAKVYTLSANGLVDGATAVLLETTNLTIAGAVAPGEATVDAATGTITFMLPAVVPWPPGAYVRVRVTSGPHNIEAPPGWWVKIPV
ncbi:MAG: Pvc16 family protein [Terracidiphilus sp.]